jgi:hypothetical protein
VRVDNKNIYFYFEKHSSLPTYYNAGVAVLNSEVARLAPGMTKKIGRDQGVVF